MSFWESIKNKRKNKEIDKIVSDMYTSNATSESETQLIQTLKKSGFSQEQTAGAMKYLHNTNSSFGDQTISQQQVNSVMNNMTLELSRAYDSMKSFLTPLENLWSQCNNNSQHTLLYLLKNDIISLVAFLSALNGEIEKYDVDFINILCHSDNQNITADTLYSFAESMNLSEIIHTKEINDKTLWQISNFSGRDTSIIQAFRMMRMPQNISENIISYFNSDGRLKNIDMIFQCYALVLTSVGSTLELNMASNLFYMGLYNYLQHQFCQIGLVTEIPPDCTNYLKIINKKNNFRL